MRLPPAVIRTLFGSAFCARKSTTMRPYVITLSLGMLRISSWLMTNKLFVPTAPVLSSPCANPPHSLPKPVVQISRISGSFANSEYFVINFPVVGWITGEQKCSMLKWGVALSAVSIFLGMEYAGLDSMTPIANAKSPSCDMRHGVRKFGMLVRFVGLGSSIISNIGDTGFGVGALGTPNPKILSGSCWLV